MNIKQWCKERQEKKRLDTLIRHTRNTCETLAEYYGQADSRSFFEYIYEYNSKYDNAAMSIEYRDSHYHNSKFVPKKLRVVYNKTIVFSMRGYFVNVFLEGDWITILEARYDEEHNERYAQNIGKL